LDLYKGRELYFIGALMDCQKAVGPPILAFAAASVPLVACMQFSRIAKFYLNLPKRGPQAGRLRQRGKTDHSKNKYRNYKYLLFHDTVNSFSINGASLVHWIRAMGDLCIGI